MTISKTLKKLEALKEVILADGKIDELEAEVLLDFIAPYCEGGNDHFIALDKLLKLAVSDGKVTREESEILVAEIDSVISFLKSEKKVEMTLCVTLGLVITFAVIWQMIQRLMS